MKTSQQPTSPNGEEKLTSSQVDSHANHSHWLEGEEERLMTATYGRTCSSVLTKSGRLGLSVRMLLESSRWYSPARLLKWEAIPLYSMRVTTSAEPSSDMSLKKSATILSQLDIQSNRCLFRLVPLARPTAETEYSSLHTMREMLLQTPTSVMTEQSPETMDARRKRNGYKNGTTYASLASQVAYDPKVAELLKTPCTFDAKTGIRSWDKPQSRGTLAQQAEMGKLEYLLPTPNTTDYNTTLSEDAKARKMERRAAEGKTAVPSQLHQLRQMARDGLLPTPMVTEVEHRNRVEGLLEKGVTDFQSRENGAQRPNGLMDYIRFHGMMLTPSASDGMRGNFSMAALRSHDKPNAEKSNLAEQIAHLIPADGGGAICKERKWRHFPTQSPVCRGNDGIPFDVDCIAVPWVKGDHQRHINKWREESLKAYGNAIVPQVMCEIFKAIGMTYEQD